MTRVAIYGGVYDGFHGEQAPEGQILLDPPVTVTADPVNVWPELPVKPARAAADFRDSPGVNVHISSFSTAYNDIDQVKAALERVGIRHARDGACAGCTTTHPRQRRLSDELGIRWTWIAGDPVDTTGTIDANLARIAELFRDVTDAIENPNEWDNNSKRIGDGSAQLRDYAQRLYAARDALLAGVPIIAPSFVRDPPRSAVGDLSALVDYGNMHAYTGDGQPEAVGFIPKQIQLAGIVAPGKPTIATETGYHNATSTTNLFRPISERAAAIYLPRLMLEHFWRGSPRAFIYELNDEAPEPALMNIQRHFGLFRSDWSEKPAVAAIRRMLDAVGDGRPTELGGLAYTVKSSVTTRDMLLQRGDGSYVLCLWRTTAAWANGADVSTGSKVSTITFGQPVVAAGQTAPRTLPVTLPGDCVAFVPITVP